MSLPRLKRTEKRSTFTNQTRRNIEINIILYLEEGNGEHYLSLRGPVNDLLDSIREDEANDTRLHTSYPNANSLPDNIRPPDDTSLPQHTSLPQNSPLIDDASLGDDISLPDITTLPNEMSLPDDSPLHDNDTSQQLSRGRLHLPNEIIETIIKYSLEIAMSMIGTFKRVTENVKRMTMKFYPFLYINPAIAKL